MYDYIRGLLVDKEPFRAVIECNNIGFEINIPLSTYDKLPETGEEVKLIIHYHYTEAEGVKLFGFIQTEERQLFRLLLGVSKIGPRIASAVLSTLSVDEFSRAILEKNTNVIATVPGIGKKSAERLVLELKDKINIADSVSSSMPYASGSLEADAEAALLTLGYSVQQIKRTLAELMKKNKYGSTETLIKEAIRYLHMKRNK